MNLIPRISPVSSSRAEPDAADEHCTCNLGVCKRSYHQGIEGNNEEGYSAAASPGEKKGIRMSGRTLTAPGAAYVIRSISVNETYQRLFPYSSANFLMSAFEAFLYCLYSPYMEDRSFGLFTAYSRFLIPRSGFTDTILSNDTIAIFFILHMRYCSDSLIPLRHRTMQNLHYLP